MTRSGVTTRTLPIRPDPVPGEAFASYLDRIAAYCDIRLLTVLARTGVIDQDRGAKSSLMAGYGVHLSPERLRVFSRVTRLPEGTVADMLLTKFDGLTEDFGDTSNLSGSLAVRTAARGKWAYFIGSHACPSCLKESGGVWKLVWKLPWSFACTHHRTLLIDSCPSCKRRLLSGRKDARCSPASPSRVPVLGTCRNTPRSRGRRFKARPEPCGHRLDEAEASVLGGGFQQIVDAQKRIDEVLRGEQPVAAGDSVASVEYFSDLRSLSAILLAWGVVDDLGEVPAAVSAAFERHCLHRHKLQGSEIRQRGPGKGGRRTPFRTYTDIPRDPALLAGVVARAVWLCESPSLEILAERISPVIMRSRADDPQRFFSRMRAFNLSSRLETARKRSVEPHQAPAHRLGSRRVRKATQRPDSTLSSSQIPQLLWENHYEDLFRNLLEPGTSTEYGRVFCSIALVKTIEKCGWGGAAVALGLPRNTGKATANNVVLRLNRTGNTDLFTSRAHDLVRFLAAAPDLMDYGSRRDALSSFEIDPEDWEDLCRSAGVHGGKSGGRRLHASVWVWGYLTCSHYYFSPWFSRNNSKSTQSVYSHFRRGVLETLRPALRIYADNLANELSI